MKMRVNDDFTHSNRIGDSLGDSQSKLVSRILDDVASWLATVLRRSISVNGPTLAHAIQPDMHSCGVYTLNTIAHAVFDDPLIEPCGATLSRTQAFNAVVAYLQLSGHISIIEPKL